MQVRQHEHSVRRGSACGGLRITSSHAHTRQIEAAYPSRRTARRRLHVVPEVGIAPFVEVLVVKNEHWTRYVSNKKTQLGHREGGIRTWLPFVVLASIETVAEDGKPRSGQALI
eukprot:317336-Rhodomonas_salina.1